MSKQTTRDDSTNPEKRAALALLAKGLASQAEVARLAGVSPQLITHWSKEIPIKRNREAVLAKLWAKELARK